MDVVGWKDGAVRLIDQRRLPAELTHLDCRTVDELWEAIKTLAVRGAPAIGVAAAYGAAMAVWDGDAGTSELVARLEAACDRLATSRPTAVNLFWALDRMRRVAAESASLPAADFKARILAEAKAVREEDLELSRRMGRAGMELIPDGATVLTHCNAGALATGGLGTALAPVYFAHAAGRKVSVLADETRPLLQGARLTAWELGQAGVPVTVITDGMAAWAMKRGKVDLVITGADRIAANGDAANKIGTYGVALAARAHGIPFHVAAPVSTFDLSLASGEEIPIEQRDPAEVLAPRGGQWAPADADAWNPAFDVTPNELIAALITDAGLLKPPYTESIRAAFGAAP
ncbi:MAG: S-methyl-5-thioribose-1-phosphate isomerase [Planctomycetota bacterium]